MATVVTDWSLLAVKETRYGLRGRPVRGSTGAPWAEFGVHVNVPVPASKLAPWGRLLAENVTGLPLESVAETLKLRGVFSSTCWFTTVWAVALLLERLGSKVPEVSEVVTDAWLE